MCDKIFKFCPMPHLYICFAYDHLKIKHDGTKQNPSLLSKSNGPYSSTRKLCLSSLKFLSKAISMNQV